MDDKEELRALIESEIRKHHWADEDIQAVLLQVARDYTWRQGLWARLKFFVNVIGLLGIIGGTALAVASVIGFEVVRK